MALGSERSLLIEHPAKRAVVGLVGDTHFGRVLRFLYLKRAIDQLSLDPTAILDAGSGKGYLALYLAKRYPRAQVAGVDLDAADLFESERIRLAACVGNLTFVRADLQHPIGVDAYDLIVSSEVLEYVRDEDAALRHLYAAVRPGGVLLLHLMDSEGGYRRVGARRLLGRNPGAWRDVGMARAGYTERGLEARLVQAGFSDVVVRPTFGPVGMFAHSCFELARTWPAPLYLLLFPLLVVLAHIDVHVDKTCGGGLLVLCGKGGLGELRPSKKAYRWPRLCA